MVYPLVGETVLTLNGETLALRPSLGALYGIEQQTGFDIASLLSLLRSGKADTAVTQAILCEGLRAAGVADKTFAAVKDAPVTQLREAAALFLARGLGVEDNETQAAPLPWRELFKAATGILGRTEQEFWNMTLESLDLMCEGAAEALGANAPPSSADIAALEARFPDHGAPR